MKVCYTWLGMTDLRAAKAAPPPAAPAAPLGRHTFGPVADFLLQPPEALEWALLLYDYAGDDSPGRSYLAWLEALLTQHRRRIRLELAPCPKGHATRPDQTDTPGGDPTDFQWVYTAMRTTIDRFERRCGSIHARHYLVGPGTPTMAACTILVARLKACAGTLWQSDQRSALGYRALQLPVGIALSDQPDPASGQAQPLPPKSAEVIVRSPASQRAWMLAERAAQSRWPVLILGPSGAGKDRLARHIHVSSGLPEEKFKPLNCAALPETMIESELFGYRKGAFTGADKDHPGIFEAANGGSVFLDEVGELSPAAQAKLLRVLQEKKVRRLGETTEREIDCRIIAATHRNLRQAVDDGRFRADLYYRLAGIIIELPPLAQRPEDLAAMIDQFWRQTIAENPGFPGRELDASARARLMAHPWPGNVRELQATLVRLAFLASGPTVTEADVQLALAHHTPPHTATPQAPTPDTVAIGDMKTLIKRYQKQLVQAALAQTRGNKTQAAKHLNITPQHLARLLKE